MEEHFALEVMLLQLSGL
uniref:Uncharacterized protein n=1 Tax=Arundo donax TaxID=35708 RepID=A0A0A9EC22_ARUDO